MKCHACEQELEKREHAQPMTIGLNRYWPKSLCDTCARANMWPAGTIEALARLGTGKTDPEAIDAVFAATRDWGISRATIADG